MSDAFHVKSPVDGITRGLNEHYDSKQDVEQDSYGAWLAIQNLWNDREELEAKLARLREALEYYDDLFEGEWRGNVARKALEEKSDGMGGGMRFGLDRGRGCGDCSVRQTHGPARIPKP